MFVVCTNLFSFQQQKTFEKSKIKSYEKLHIEVKKVLLNDSKRKPYMSKNISQDIDRWKILNNLRNICDDIDIIEEELDTLTKKSLNFNNNKIYTQFMLIKTWTRPQ
jgi:hypothetical protein